MTARDVLELPPELAQLEGLASAADAQLAGVDQVPGAEPAPVVDETAEVAGALTLASSIVGMACKPIAEVYDAQACQAIAEQYMRCAEAYGWTWHRQINSPVVGLIAAAAMPAIMNAGKFRAWAAEQKAKAIAKQRAATSTPAPIAAPAPMAAPVERPTYSPGHVAS